MKRNTTLVFLRRDHEILLAMKKRDFGINKWNGAGGKVEAGESIEEAAVRECQEEIGIAPKDLKLCGILHFFDLPDVEHYCYIYTATEWEGQPIETDEMRPQWFAESKIPYKQMWPDDELWIPLMLAGKLFKGRVVIENDRIKEYQLAEVSSL